MNNIYVEIKEKCCSKCDAECDGCWLEELIANRLAEERKKVVQDIRDYMEKHSYILPVISKKRNVIYKIGLTRFLDQIEGAKR